MARIRHLAIISENRERLVEFYTKAFGMKQVESAGPAIYLTDGYLNLALIQKRPHNKAGLYHFGFVVDEIEPLVPLCKELGAASEVENRPYQAETRVHDPTAIPSTFPSEDGQPSDLSVVEPKREFVGAGFKPALPKTLGEGLIR